MLKKQSTRSRAAVLPGDPTIDYPFTLPYGLRPAQGVLVPDGEKAAVVKRIFEKAEQGDSRAQIAEMLKGEQVEPPEGADDWTAEVIETILGNPAYIGEWGGFGRVEEPLIDKELFAVANSRSSSAEVA